MYLYFSIRIGFLELINNMLTSGMVPALFGDDEKEQIIGQVCGTFFSCLSFSNVLNSCECSLTSFFIWIRIKWLFIFWLIIEHEQWKPKYTPHDFAINCPVMLKFREAWIKKKINRYWFWIDIDIVTSRIRLLFNMSVFYVSMTHPWKTNDKQLKQVQQDWIANAAKLIRHWILLYLFPILIIQS